MAQLKPISNSVFVNVEPPEPLQQVASAQRQGRVWAKVATAIASETRTADRRPQTAKNEQRYANSEVRVYRIDGSRTTHLYTGNPDPDMDGMRKRCQKHADRTGCVVRMHTASNFETFSPSLPRTEKAEVRSAVSGQRIANSDIPIGTPKEMIKIYRTDTPQEELLFEVLKECGWVGWCERYVKEHPERTLKAVGFRYTRFFESQERWLAERQKDRPARLTVDMGVS